MSLPKPGSKCVLRIAPGPSEGSYALLEGLRLTSWKIEQNEVDVTIAEGSGWRRLLSGAGLRAIEVQVAGLYLRSEGELRLRQAALNGTAFAGELILDEGEAVTGSFIASELRFDSAVNEEVTYAAVLRSAGPITVS